VDLGLRDSVCVVTGSTGGIGLETARLLVAEGAQVVTTGRSGNAPDVGEALHVTAELGAAGEPERLIDHTEAQLGRVDVLVNNVGVAYQRTFAEVTDAQWDELWQLNVMSYVRSIRAVLPGMTARGAGVIVNVSSTAGRRGLPFRIGYCSAKAGQVGMTYGLALELSPHNIRVNAIAPGAVEGDRIDRVIAGQAEVRRMAVEDMRRSFVERSPLKRMTTAEDIATLAIYLCSDAAKNLSGQCIAVTAGEPAV
jgi:NAD(P)-dependent dehydrogenase (short-subunit alcohol dehydrogenase family)